MKKSHTQATKANRGKRADAPEKGLPTIKVEFAPNRFRYELDLSGYTKIAGVFVKNQPEKINEQRA